MSAIESIMCDGCGERKSWFKGYGASNWDILRSVHLKPLGWHVVKKKGEPVRDICRFCWARGKR